MRIERIRVDAFGRLAGFDTGAEPLGSLVAILGPNEAGKSTLFSFLTTALYGFHPASRERNPHVPWGSDEAAGSVEILLDDGARVHVSRRMRSSPSGTVEAPDGTTSLSNRALPWVEHVPGAVFHQVFAVTLRDLAGLDVETWSGIEDRLVGSMGSSDLLPARGVAEALEREASALWRPNRRGNQRIRELHVELRALRARRADALDRDRRIRAKVEERENVLLRLRETRAERQRLRLALERVQSLLPVKRQLTRIEALRREGGDPVELASLPTDPVGEVERLEAERDRLKRACGEMEHRMAGPREALAAFDEEAERLLARADEVTAFLARARHATAERAEARALRSEADTLRRRLVAEADRVLEGGWSDEVEAALSALSIELLRERVARSLESADARSESGGTGAGATGPRPPGARPAAAVVLLVMAGASGAWAVLGGPAAAGTAAVGLGAAGLVVAAQAVARLFGDRDLRRRDERAGREAARRRTQATREGVLAALAGIPVRSEFLDPPGSALPDALARLRDVAERTREKAHSLAALESRLAEVDAEARALVSSLGGEDRPTAESVAAFLGPRLEGARRSREGATAAERDLVHLRRERDDTARRLANANEALARLAASLPATPSGSLHERAVAAKRRLDAHGRAVQLMDELERSRPDLDEAIERIAEAERQGTALRVDDEERAKLAAREEEAELRVEALVAEAQALERDVEHLRDMETVDAVDGEAEALRDAEAALERERDRKWILAQILRTADRRFREEHQPDLVRRAGAHLERLTGGRYDRLLIGEDDREGPFHLVGPGLPAPVPLRPPISTGTLEQAYLGLRLAIVDHLDEGRERLPLFIDEAFVNWDPGRRERGFDVLAELSAQRQIFVFTCHPETADSLRKRSARVVRLER